jgi:uncharacterized protein (TIGR03086 family)
MDVLAEYASAISRNIERIEDLRPDQLAGPTPCSDWDVTALLAHMIGGHQMFAAALGQPLPPPGTDTGASVAGMVASYRVASEASLKAFGAPGALQRVVALPIGEVPADLALGLALTDAVVHRWDLASATGQDTSIDDRVAAPLLAGAQSTITPDLRQPDGVRPAFAEPVQVGEDCPAGERLVAFLGRPPHFG